MTPFVHQTNSAKALAKLLQARKVAADSSETGTGKTVSALLAADYLGLEFLTICPKNVKTHWLEWVREMGLWDRCRGILGWEEAKLGLQTQIYDPKIGFFGGCRSQQKKLLIIFDEAHRAKEGRTKNAQMLTRARAQGFPLLLLSATLLQSPLNLSGLAYPLGLVSFRRQWFGYAQQFGAGINRWGGYADLSTREHRLRLHHLLSQIGVRVRRSDIPEFREGLYQADLLDAGQARDSIRQLYESLASEIERLSCEGAKAAEILVARLRGRQAIELLKAPLFAEIAGEHLEAGAKVALFLNFGATIDFLRALAWKVPVRVITGQTTEKARGEALASFQTHSGACLLLANIACASEGISLHDVDGRERVSLISPGESATHLIQAMGRNVRTGAKSPGLNRILFIARTVEELVYRNTRAKIRAIANLMDGDLDLFPQLETNHA